MLRSQAQLVRGGGESRGPGEAALLRDERAVDRRLRGGSQGDEVLDAEQRDWREIRGVVCEGASARERSRTVSGRGGEAEGRARVWRGRECESIVLNSGFAVLCLTRSSS